MNSTQVIEVKQIDLICATMAYLSYKTSTVFNRKTRRSHAAMIEESFKFFGTSGSTIIVVKTRAISGKVEYYIADGQHRVLAATRLNLPLNVSIVELVEDTKLNLIKYVSALNSKSKQWNTATYLEKFTECGEANYEFFTEKKKLTGLTISDLCNIFTGSASSQQLKAFKEGEINIADIADSEALLNAVMTVKGCVPNKAYSRRSLYTIFRLSSKEIGYKKMAKAILKAHEAGLEFSENERELLNELKAIYKTLKAK